MVAAEKIGGVVQREAQQRVVGKLVDHLKDGVVEVLAGPRGDESQRRVGTRDEGRFVGDAQEFVVAVLIKRDVAGGGLARIGLQLGFGEVARQFGIGLHGGHVEPCLDRVGQTPAGVGEYALVLLPGVVAEAVLLLLRERPVSVGPAENGASGDGRAQVIPRADFQAGETARRGASGARNIVDRTTERGRPVGQRVAAPPDIDVGGRRGLQRLHIKAAVGEIDGHAVLQHADAAPVKSALQARAANRQSRLVRTETRLGHDARRQEKRIGQRRGATSEIAGGIDRFDAARRAGKIGARGIDRWNSQRLLVGGDLYGIEDDRSFGPRTGGNQRESRVKAKRLHDECAHNGDALPDKGWNDVTRAHRHGARPTDEQSNQHPRRRHRRRRTIPHGGTRLARHPFSGHHQFGEKHRLGLEHQQDLARRLRIGRQRGVLLLLGLAHAFTHAAKVVGREGQLDRLDQRHALRIGRDHAPPGKRLHHIPMASRGQQPRGQHRDKGEFPAHEPRSKESDSYGGKKSMLPPGGQ